MQVTSTLLAAPRSIVIIEDDVEALEKRKGEIWGSLKDKVELQGFRKGHVPRSVVEKRFDLAELYRDVVNEVLQRGITQSQLSVCHVQSATIVDWKKDQPLHIEAIVDINPGVVSVDYKRMVLQTSPPEEVTEEQIEAVVQRTRESLATIKSLEEQRSAGVGDLVVVDFKGVVNNKPFEGGSAENFQLKLGSGSAVADFEAAIVGMSKSETKEAVVTFPEDYYNKKLAKKKAHFTITLKDIHIVEYPELDDEMAKDAGYDDLVVMREALKKDLVETNHENHQKLIQAQLLQQLVASAQIDPIPESIVQRQLENILHEIMKRLDIQDPAEYFKKTKQKQADFEYQYRPRALEDLKSKIVLEHIADQEGFVVTDEEREEYIRTSAVKTNVTPAQFRQMLSSDSIDLNIRMQRATAFVADHAEISHVQE